MSTWRPLSRRHEPEEAEATLYEGVPSWLQASLIPWAEQRVSSRGMIDEDQIRRVARSLRWDIRAPTDLWREFQFRLLSQSEDLLDVVDFLLSVEPLRREAEVNLAVVDVMIFLREAGSAWTVDDVDGRWGLVRRLPAEIATVVEAVSTVADRSGEHPRSARSHLYGRSPSPGEAYRDAVRAVEAAAKPVVTPKDSLSNPREDQSGSEGCSCGEVWLHHSGPSGERSEGCHRSLARPAVRRPAGSAW